MSKQKALEMSFCEVSQAQRTICESHLEKLLLLTSTANVSAPRETFVTLFLFKDRILHSLKSFNSNSTELPYCV